MLAVSEDHGGHFRYERIPVMIHGNLNGRGTGERLIVDQKDPAYPRLRLRVESVCAANIGSRIQDIPLFSVI